MNLITKAKDGIVLDGAMSDELERQGVQTNNKLWTATALTDELDKVYQAHWNYFEAGAELVITDTYQANVQAFIKAGYSQRQAQQFIRSAVKIAKKARDDFEKKSGKHNYVAGTVGSYGAYLADGNEYRGDYNLTEQEYLEFHLPRLRLILAEKPDLIALGGVKMAHRQTHLERKMSTRHIRMISLGGVIGTGLFLSSGYTIHEAGPLGTVLAYLVGGLIVFVVMQCLGELSVAMPYTGSFHVYAKKYIGPSTGFVVAILYWLTWTIALGS